MRRLIHFLAFLYLAAAVLFTSTCLFRSGFSLFFHNAAHSRGLTWTPWRRTVGPFPSSRSELGFSLKTDQKPLRSSVGVSNGRYALMLGQSTTGAPAELALNGGLFMSKAFSFAIHPPRIMPYFYRGFVSPDAEDITITTLITSSRFRPFKRLVQHYGGPISVTVHVGNNTEEIRNMIQVLDALYTTSLNFRNNVDVHLIIDSFDRQFNTWRNMARLFARTDFVMMLDVDFYICTDFRTAIRASKFVMNKLRSGLSAFVIPAFEYVRYADGLNPAVFPRDKKSLTSLVRAKRVAVFHAAWGPGHNSTDYRKYFASAPGDVYKVTQYQSAYEPYVIFRKNGAPWCDERFVGYGGNKAACHFEMYISGINYYVLSDHFIVHQNHRYEETARKNERRYNRRLYSDFKEEACIRYLNAFHATDMLNTSRSYNAQHECKNVKKVALRYSEWMFD